MATLNDTLAAIERHLGFPKSRSRTIARRLQEAGLLPLGAPGIAPDLAEEDVVTLIIALAADTTLHGAPAAARAYRALTPGGVAVEGAPDSIRNAGDTLDIFAEWAIRGDADLLRNDRVEFVSNWPEIVLQEPNATKRFVAAGKLAGHWQENGHRKSTTINGSALVDCLRSLFSGDNQ